RHGGQLGRAMAASALKDLGPAARGAVPAVVEVMRKDPESQERWGAAGLLGHLGAAARDAVPALLEAAKDKDQWVRQGAAFALYRIAPAAARQAGIPEALTGYQIFLNATREDFDKG